MVNLVAKEAFVLPNQDYPNVAWFYHFRVNFVSILPSVFEDEQKFLAVR